MKMSRFFFLPVCAGTVKGIDIRSTIGHYNDGVEPFEAAEYAINNHDPLTAQNAKLLEYLDAIVGCYDSQEIAHHFGIDDDRAIAIRELLNEIKET